MAVEIRHFKQDYQALKREVSRLASMANKRLVRLENNGFEDSPAYKQWIESGGEKFSVRGKDYNALQKELARVRQFVNAKTSTIRGAQSVLKAIAANTGANFKGKELWAQASNFFRVASMIEQYIRNTENVASAIGYQKSGLQLTSTQRRMTLTLRRCRLTWNNGRQHCTDDRN